MSRLSSRAPPFHRASQGTPTRHTCPRGQQPLSCRAPDLREETTSCLFPGRGRRGGEPSLHPLISLVWGGLESGPGSIRQTPTHPSKPQLLEPLLQEAIPAPHLAPSQPQFPLSCPALPAQCLRPRLSLLDGGGASGGAPWAGSSEGKGGL